MNNFLNSLSHPCLYRRGIIRVLEGVIFGRRSFNEGLVCWEGL